MGRFDYRDDGSSQFERSNGRPYAGGNQSNVGNPVSNPAQVGKRIPPQGGSSTAPPKSIPPAVQAVQGHVKAAESAPVQPIEPRVYSKFNKTKMGENYYGPVAIVTMQQKVTRNNDPYMEYMLQDSSGQMSAKWFNMADTTSKPGDIIIIDGIAGEWLGRPQYGIHKAEVTTPGQIDVSEVLPTTPFNRSGLEKGIRERVEKIKCPVLKGIVAAVVTDNKEVWTKYRECPGGKSVHHSYVGGLMEHVLSMIRYADAMAPIQGLDADLMVAGVVLHDVGKIWEYVWNPIIEYSPRGKLFGHLTMGYGYLVGAASAGLLANEFNSVKSDEFTIKKFKDYVDHLGHMILSHHDKPEYGACVRPQTREAILLAEIDKTDCFAWRSKHLTEQDKSERLPHDFFMEVGLYNFDSVKPK